MKEDEGGKTYDPCERLTDAVYYHMKEKLMDLENDISMTPAYKEHGEEIHTRCDQNGRHGTDNGIPK